MDKLKLLKFSLIYSVKNNLPFFFKEPIHIETNITAACNSRCGYCSAWKNKGAKDLSTTEWKKIIYELKKEFGLFFLTFSGGEPFLRKDILELVDFASNEGLPTNLITNATLINKKNVDKIINSKLYQLTISLDCIKPGTYNRIRGIKKNFDKIIPTIRYINKRRRNLKLKIAAVILKQNLDEIKGLADFARNENIPIVFQPLMPKFWSNDHLNPDWYKKNRFWPNPRSAEKALNQLITLKKEGYPITNSINHLRRIKDYFNNPNQSYKNIKPICSRSLRIRPDGITRLCFYSPSIGNLKYQHIRDIWASKNISLYTKRKAGCGGCILRNCNFP